MAAAAGPLLHEIRRSPGQTLVLSLFYLGLWCQIGVLTRSYLDRVVSIGCNEGDWGPCWVSAGTLPSGLFAWLASPMVANTLGAFILGCLTPSRLLDLPPDAKVALLPPGQSWQENDLMLLGLRTGFCGCLTTYSSWVAAEVVLAVKYNRYFDMVYGLLMGVLSAATALMLGEMVAILVHRLWHGGSLHSYPRELEKPEIEFPLPGPGEAGGDAGANGQPGAGGDAPPGGDPPGGDLEMQPAGGAADGAGDGTSAFDGAGGGPEGGKRAAADGGVLGRSGRRGSAASGGASKASLGRASTLPLPDSTAPGNDVVQPVNPDGGDATTPRGIELQQLLSDVTRGFCQNKSDVVHVLGCVGCLALFIALLAAYDNGAQVHKDTRTWFFAIVVGPPGCYMRWQLSRLNSKGKGFWKYFPTGTFLANLSGTTIYFGLAVIAQRASLGYWGSVVVSGFQLGFCGSLTTLSTWVFELRQSLKYVRSGVLLGFIDAVVSPVSALIVGFSLYGWSVWVD